MLAQWSRLITFYLNAHQLFRFGLYRTIRPSGLLPEYIHISEHKLSVLEKKRGGSFETTIQYLSMDLLVHLEGEERQTFQQERRIPR